MFHINLKPRRLGYNQLLTITRPPKAEEQSLHITNKVMISEFNVEELRDRYISVNTPDELKRAVDILLKLAEPVYERTLARVSQNDVEKYKWLYYTGQWSGTTETMEGVEVITVKELEEIIADGRFKQVGVLDWMDSESPVKKYGNYIFRKHNANIEIGNVLNGENSLLMNGYLVTKDQQLTMFLIDQGLDFSWFDHLKNPDNVKANLLGSIDSFYAPSHGVIGDLFELFTGKRFQHNTESKEFLHGSDRFWEFLGTCNYDLKRWLQMKDGIFALRNKKGEILYNYLDLRSEDKGLVSYMPAGKKQEYGENGKWKREGRQTIKIGALIKRLLPVEIQLDDKEIERISNLFKLAFMEGEFKVLEGDEIRWGYHEENHCNDKILGSEPNSAISGSCMRYHTCQDYFSIYEERAKLLVLVTPDNKILGRALLWDNVTFDRNKPEGAPNNFMDRIYSYREQYETAFKRWATENGYNHKLTQKMDAKTSFVAPNGVTFYSDIEVEMEHPIEHYDPYPYTDTLHWALGRTIYNHDNNENFTHEFDHTAGEYTSGVDRVMCDRCEESVNDDDITWIDNRAICDSCRGNHYSYDNIDDRYISDDDLVTAQRANGRSVETHHQNTTSLYDGTTVLTNDYEIVETYNGEMALIDDTFVCEADGEYYLISEMVEHNGLCYYEKNVPTDEDEAVEEEIL